MFRDFHIIFLSCYFQDIKKALQFIIDVLVFIVVFVYSQQQYTVSKEMKCIILRELVRDTTRTSEKHELICEAA